jgi:hypothetical protein
VIVIRLEVEWQRVPFATAETKQEAQESIVQALRAQGDDAVVM